MAQESYREYMCSRVEGGCGFRVQAPTERETVEHARRHLEEAHGMKEMSPEMERNIKREVRPVSREEGYKEYACTEPGCDFSIRAKDEDEVIEHAHMHQDVAHEVKETLSETKEKVKEKIKSI